jgi:hypothetical protein
LKLRNPIFYKLRAYDVLKGHAAPETHTFLVPSSAQSLNGFTVVFQGYYQENNFLITQWPMQHTVNDIWRLIYDYKITSLVVLNEQKFSRVSTD